MNVIASYLPPDFGLPQAAAVALIFALWRL